MGDYNGSLIELIMIIFIIICFFITLFYVAIISLSNIFRNIPFKETFENTLNSLRKMSASLRLKLKTKNHEKK